MHVEQPALGAILERVGPEHGRVDLGDRVQERREAIRLRPPVREEQALVLPGKGGPDAVLEQARAAHDERPVPEVVEREGEALHDLGREVRVLEDLDHVRVLAPHLVDLEVLAVVEVVELVVLDEVEDSVRRDVPGLRDPDLAERVRELRRLADDLSGEEESGGLAAHAAVAPAAAR